MPDILREMHGITSPEDGNPKAREKLKELMSIAGVSDIDSLAPGLRKLGLTDEQFSPHHMDDAELQDRFRYSRMVSWDKAHRQKVDCSNPKRVLDFQAEYSSKVITVLTGWRYLLDPRQWKRLVIYLYGAKPDGLGRPGLGDPWTPMLKQMIAKGELSSTDPVLTLGPRTIAEIKHFRKVIGLKKTIGLDLFTYSPRHIIKGDMHAMPWPDNHFEVVYQRNTFDKAYDIRLALRECARVLRPGGLLLSDLPMGNLNGVDEAGRTSITRNEWILRFLGDKVTEILFDKDDYPAPSVTHKRLGRLAVKLRK